MKKVFSESEMMEYGRELARGLKRQPGFTKMPTVIELVGDVGAGKTTLVRGLAKELGVAGPVTSPSFTISKTYAFDFQGENYTLTHYDFYRLGDPGLMAEDLAEMLATQHSVVVVEWAGNVQDFLPEERITIKICYSDDGGREIETNKAPS